MKKKKCAHSLGPPKRGREQVADMAQYQMRALGYEVQTKRPISSGSYGSVYKATFKGKQVACKIIDLTKTSLNYKTKFLPRELDVINRLTHEFIISTYRIFRVSRLGDLCKIFIYMEMARTDLLSLVSESRGLNEPTARTHFQQMVAGLEYMHSLRIAHRDLKPENVLVSMDGKAKLADFGFARVVDEDPSTRRPQLSRTFCGSRAYEAPEILMQEPYDALLADVWAMGCTLFVMVNDSFAFNDKDQKLMVKTQLRQELTFSRPISGQLEDLLREMMEPRVNVRPSISQVSRHPWLEPSSNVRSSYSDSAIFDSLE